MKLFNVLVISILIVFNLSCEKCSECPDDNDQSNHPPQITDILISPNPPIPNYRAYLTAVAIDQDNDSLSYYWNASSGQFSYLSSYGTTTNPTYWAEYDSGLTIIKVIVSDGMSLDSMSVNVVVN